MPRTASYGHSSKTRRIDVPRSKNGCYTCRLRRKACDAHDQETPCPQCVRLKIECLGYGEKRPEWCRDKQKLTQWKLELKKKLSTRAGVRANTIRQAQVAGQHASYSPGPSSSAGNSTPDFATANLPEATTSYLAPQSEIPIISLVEGIANLAESLNIAEVYRTTLGQIVELARWKETATQMNSLAPGQLEDRARAIEQKMLNQLSGASSVDDFAALGFGGFGFGAPSHDGLYESPIDAFPELALSDTFSSPPQSPEFADHFIDQSGLFSHLYTDPNVSPFLNPTLISPASSYAHTFSPPTPLNLPLMSDATFGNYLGIQETPYKDVTPTSSSLLLMNSSLLPSFDSNDVYASACKLLLQVIVTPRPAQSHDIQAQLNNLGKAFMPQAIGQQGATTSFAACVAGCFSSIPEQRRFFQSAVAMVANDPGVYDACQGLMSFSWATASV